MKSEDYFTITPVFFGEEKEPLMMKPFQTFSMSVGMRGGCAAAIGTGNAAQVAERKEQIGDPDVMHSGQKGKVKRGRSLHQSRPKKRKKIEPHHLLQETQAENVRADRKLAVCTGRSEISQNM